MVDRAIVIVFAGLVVAAAGAGTLVGLYLEGSLAIADATTPSPTPNAVERSARSPTPTATPRPTVAPSSFDATTIEEHVRAMVNTERQSQGLAPLASLDQLRAMARFHSDAMADQGYASHAAAGYTAAERYERFDLADRCRIADDSGSSIREDRELEMVAKTVAGRPHGRDGDVARNETAVARALVGGWVDDATARERLTMRNAERVGVGITVAPDGGVYATVALC